MSGVVVHPGAFALRPIRIDVRGNCFINYEGTTFPENPWAGCEMWLRRVSLYGLSDGGDGDLGIDVLDKNGDILQTFSVCRDGFNYLRRSLKFRKLPTPARLTEGEQKA